MPHRNSLFAIATVAAGLNGCAAPRSFRLAGPTLIPPGVKDASVARATIPVSRGKLKAMCEASASGLEVRRKTIVVSGNSLKVVDADELMSWTAGLEGSGCILTGEAAGLREAVVNSLPLDLTKRRQLSGPLAAGAGQELKEFNSLRVVSPVLRPGAAVSGAIGEGPLKVTAGSGYNLNVEVRANADLTGYEVAWYDVKRRDDGAGLHIVARAAEIHIDGKVEQHPAPQTNRLTLAPDARWFRYFLMTGASQNDHSIVVLSAPTAIELEGRTASFRKDAAAYLRGAEKTSFAAMTREIGVNPFLRIIVNGAATDVAIGSSVRQAIEQAGGAGTAAKIASRLSIRKPYGPAMALVEWDRTQQNILDLPIEGGEQISW